MTSTVEQIKPALESLDQMIDKAEQRLNYLYEQKRRLLQTISTDQESSEEWHIDNAYSAGYAYACGYDE